MTKLNKAFPHAYQEEYVAPEYPVDDHDEVPNNNQAPPVAEEVTTVKWVKPQVKSALGFAVKASDHNDVLSFQLKVAMKKKDLMLLAVLGLALFVALRRKS